MKYISRDISQKLIILAIAFLVVYGFVMVISTTYILAGETYGNNYFFIKKHLISLVLGFIVFYLVRFINISKLEKYIPLFIGISLLLLLLTLVPGLGVKIYGARRWIKFLPFFRFQTSELAKISIIFFLANYYNKHQGEDFKTTFLKPLIVIGLLVLAVLIEPDFSTSMLLVILAFGMMAAAGVKLRILAGSGFLATLFGAAAIFSSPYRMKRVLSFLDPWKDPANSGFQIIQSYIAIYLGGATGVGLGNSKEKLFYLPEAHNDFILSIISEETGVLGITVLFILFGMIVYAGIRVALRLDETFKTLLAFGISFLFFLQFAFNVSVVLGLFPVTGVPLPFISYGGTALITTMFLLGILYELSKEV